MITDTEIRLKGLQVLAEFLGDIEAERFVPLIQREPFDYTKWRQGLDEDLSITEISQKAMALRNKNTRRLRWTWKTAGSLLAHSFPRHSISR